MKAFNTLPMSIQGQIKNTLRAYNEVDVYFENGEYHFGLVLKDHYAPDHEYIGRYFAKDVFSEEEIIVNYVNEFRCFPINYKGDRDYEILKDYNATYIMVDGNIVKA